MAVTTELLGILTSSGFVTSWMALDFIGLFALVYASWNIVKPTIEMYQLTKYMDDIAGKTSKHWLYGHSKQFPPTEEGLLKAAQRPSSHPTMFNHWLAPLMTSLNLYHSDTAISLLSSGAPKNELVYRYLRCWIGDGLLTSKGKKWQRNRHLLTPAFHFNILKGYAQIANQCAKTMLDKWEKLEGRSIDITDDVSLMTLDTMLRCAMSSVTDCQHVRNGHPYIKAVKELAQIIMKRTTTPYLFPDFIFWRTALGKQCKQAMHVVHTHAEQIIAERRNILQQEKLAKELPEQSDGNSFFQNNKKMLDFLDILIQTRDEEGKGLTDREIRDEVDTFLFEGHDTTSSGISWALYNLAKHPEIQEKCRKEVNSILGTQQNIKWNELSKFSYLTMVIKESMRLYPPVFSIGRKLDKPMSLRSKLNKYAESVVPKGSRASVHIFALHRNELIWDKPEEFNPERFTQENIAKRPPHAYLPFSAGSRNCIGQNFAMNEMKIALSQTLQRFRLYLDDETPTPVMEPRLILQSKDGIFIKLQSL